MDNYVLFYYSKSTISSVYCWDNGDSITNGFGISVLIISKDPIKQSVMKTINVVNIKFQNEQVKNKELIRVTYKLTSTMNIQLNTDYGIFNISLSKSGVEESSNIDQYLNYDFHYEKIGKLIEATENLLRVQIEHTQINKIKDVLNNLKPQSDSAVDNRRSKLLEELYDNKKK